MMEKVEGLVRIELLASGTSYGSLSRHLPPEVPVYLTPNLPFPSPPPSSPPTPNTCISHRLRHLHHLSSVSPPNC